MLTILQAATEEHKAIVRDLFSEYLHWAAPEAFREYAVVFDPEEVLKHDLENLQIFSPPNGRLLLAYDDSIAAGVACVRTIGPNIAEIKRMYVRPAFRRRGIGRALIDIAIKEVRAAGYSTLRLDSARFMTDAHAAYRSAGFRDVSPYLESEIPAAYHPYWVFMELSLVN
jgi:GNAT superfamily N-acetyltransferase